MASAFKNYVVSYRYGKKLARICAIIQTSSACGHVARQPEQGALRRTPAFDLRPSTYCSPSTTQALSTTTTTAATTTTTVTTTAAATTTTS